MELPQLVAQRFANHLRELVGGHAAQKDFLGHNDSNLVDDAKKGFPNPSRKRRMALQISVNRCQPVPYRRHAAARFRTLAFVCFGWHCHVIGFCSGQKNEGGGCRPRCRCDFESIGTVPIPPERRWPQRGCRRWSRFERGTAPAIRLLSTGRASDVRRPAPRPAPFC